jgi:hypothetical protein
MMTPVYNIAIADSNTNRCGVTRHAARLNFSAISKTRGFRKHNSSPINKHLFPCCLHNVKKYTFQGFHFIFDETSKYLHRTQQPTRNNSLLTNKSSIQDVLSNYRSHNIYSSEANFLTYYNIVKSGTDALWQQARFELKVKKVRVMHFVATSKNNRRTTPQPPLTRRSNAA